MLHSGEFVQTVILIVKRLFDLPGFGVIAVAASLILLAGCGQKGPLFLPAKQQATASSKPATAPPLTVPAPLAPNQAPFSQ